MEGIAEELGRVEDKLAQMLSGGGGNGGGGGPDCPPDGPPVEVPPYEFPSGSYELAPVCEVGPDGQPAPPAVASWPAGEGELLEIRYRIDALAELLQAHKNQRQPVCRRPAPVGQEVTVNFMEIQ